MRRPLIPAGDSLLPLLKTKRRIFFSTFALLCSLCVLAFFSSGCGGQGALANLFTPTITPTATLTPIPATPTETPTPVPPTPTLSETPTETSTPTETPLPTELPAADLAGMLRVVRPLLANRPFTVSMRMGVAFGEPRPGRALSGSPQQVTEALKAYAQAGMSYAVLDFQAESQAERERAMRLFMQEVAPAVG